MATVSRSKLDRLLAQVCRHCPVCQRARAEQQGVAFKIVSQVERTVCPFCRAYERVYGRPAHELLIARPPKDPVAPI
jgi:hypothetical protein